MGLQNTMCGLVAIYNKKSNLIIDPSIIVPMLDAIEHRGNDSVVYKYLPSIHVGYRRLAITNVDDSNCNFEWDIYLNGEIYNYKELGFIGSECNVLSQGFDKYGVEFVKQLNGMFVIVAISPDGQVYVFRDRYGIKPLYFYEDEDVIVLASEIKSILKYPNYKFSINESAKEQWFTFNNVFTDETLFDGIYKVDKATIWHLNKNRATKFWEWKFEPVSMNFEWAKKRVKELVTQAIQRMIPNEVSYASCLSGGVDSNIIASQLPKETPKYTVGFENADDEIDLVTKTTKKIYSVIYENAVWMDETIYHLEDLRVGACWSNYGLFDFIADGKTKVVFDGSGADELFGGYPWRYSEPNYYDVLNRTKNDSEYCKEVYGVVFPKDTLEERFKFDAENFLEGVLLVTDRMSMAHTLEVRLPYLDNDLVDFCLTLPNEFKENKMILKEAFKDELHPLIYSGKKKGFSSPDWFPKVGNQAKNWATAAFTQWNKIFNNGLI